MKQGDPVSEGAARAIEHLNEDHDDALLDMARAIGGCAEGTAARCGDAARTGLDPGATTPAGEGDARVPDDEPIDAPEALRKATVKLAHRARAELGAQA